MKQTVSTDLETFRPTVSARQRAAARGLLASVLFAALTACGGGAGLPVEGKAPSLSPETARADAAATTRPAALAAKPVSVPVLEGPPGLPLDSSLRDYAAPEPVAGAASAPATVRFAVTAKPAVTVGEVNRALAAVGARIVDMRAHDLTFSIEVNDAAQADFHGMVLARLEASNVFESVLPLN